MRKIFSIGIVAVLGAGLLPAQSARTAEVELKAAQHKAEVEGDLNGSIQQYGAIAAKYMKSDRSVAAMALVRMAECYQKMGDAEAHKIYEQVVREYGDQKEAVAQARAHLGSGESSGIVARQIWKSGGMLEAMISPDGRTLALGGSLALRDIASGETTNIYPAAIDARGFGEWPVLSTDSRRVAYSWYGPDDDNYQVRVADAQAGAKPRILLRNPEFVYYFLRGWSPDNKAVLALIHMRGNTTQLAWISTQDGSCKTLKSLEWRSPGMVSLSPDGRFLAYDVLAQRDSSEREIRVLAADGSSESVVVSRSGNNSAPVWTRDGARLLFLSKRSGNFGLWSIAVREGKPSGPVELVKPDTGLIQPLGFARNGSFLYVQNVGNMDVYANRIDPASGKWIGIPVRIVDTYVGSNLNPSWSPDGKSIAYISRRTSTDQTSPAVLVIRAVDTGQERTIPATFGYPSRPIWFADGQRVLVLGRNNQNNSSFYMVDVKTGEVRELLNMGTEAPPSLALSPDGKTAYAEPLGKKAGTVAAYDLATGLRTDIYTAADPIFGLAASPDGRHIAVVAEPRGGRPVGPSHLYVANPDGSQARDLFAASPQNEYITAVTFSPDSRWIYFVHSDSPSLSGTHVSKIWRIPANGGQAEFTGISANNIGQIDFAPDGTQLIYGVGEQVHSELWALDNLEHIGHNSK